MIALGAACLWLIAANFLAMFPSRDHHWTNANALMALGLPILVWVWWLNGWLMAALVLAAAGSVLRWPVYFLIRWIRRKSGIETAE